MVINNRKYKPVSAAAMTVCQANHHFSIPPLMYTVVGCMEHSFSCFKGVFMYIEYFLNIAYFPGNFIW